MSQIQEDDGVITLIEEVKTLDIDEDDGVITLIEEVKTLDEDEDEPTPAELKLEFFTLIADLQKKFPTYTSVEFKNYLENDTEMSEQLKILKENFHLTFQDVDTNDPEYVNLLIGLSSIGIEIPKEKGDDDDEGDEGDEDDEGDDIEYDIEYELKEMGAKCDEDEGDEKEGDEEIEMKEVVHVVSAEVKQVVEKAVEKVVEKAIEDVKAEKVEEQVDDV